MTEESKKSAYQVATTKLINQTKQAFDMTEEANEQRNAVIDEIVAELEKLKCAFGVDTVDSFIVFIRGFKR